MDYRFGCLGAMLLVALVSPVHAQVTIPQEYDKLIKHRGEITAFGNEGFGDKIDLGSGGLQITQTDIDIPGNNALPVRVSRRFLAGNQYGGGFFGVWSLDLPHLHGTFANHVYNPKGWTVPGSGVDVYKRCSKFSAPPVVFFQSGVYKPDEYWYGSFFHLPGAGDQELLGAGSGTHAPNDGNTYPIVTKEGAAVRCVALASTSESGSQGEGFEVVTPDGLIYTLNQMMSSAVALISKPVGQKTLLKSERSSRQTTSGPVILPNLAVDFTLPRNEVYIYPTKVTDRFGNSVTYTWSTTNPWQLTQISSSDGRQITFTYGTNIVVSDGTHTWTYASSGGIDTVTLPDGSAWRYNLSSLFNFELQTDGDGCDSDIVNSGLTDLTGSVTAPTGATATFTLTPVLMGRSWVPKQCVYDSGGYPIYAVEPKEFFNLAVTGKTITGPGLPAGGKTWAYAYGAPNSCWSSGSGACTASSPTTRSMTMTNPDGVVNQYTFGNKFAVNEGMQVKVDYGWNGTSALRSVETTYADAYAAPYWAYNGTSPRKRGDKWTTNEMHPQRQVDTTQQGRTFTWKVETGCSGVPYCFDSYGRPTKVSKTSSP
jgi:hypothetical protein